MSRDQSRSKRSGVLASSVVLLAAVVLLACTAGPVAASVKEFVLPPLPYPYNALEPIIDTETMKLHHDGHQADYVTNLNTLLKAAQEQYGKDLSGFTLTEMVLAVGTGSLGLMADAENQVRNNAGGHWNHAFFWRVMAPPGSPETVKPSDSSELGQALARDFGGVQQMVDDFTSVATKHFGSGFTWLVYDPAAGRLLVLDTLNQDNPLSPVAYEAAPGIPILGLDVWEHAYYLKYKNKKADYIKAWWGVVNWKQVADNYKIATAARAAGGDTAAGAGGVAAAGRALIGGPSVDSAQPAGGAPISAATPEDVTEDDAGEGGNGAAAPGSGGSPPAMDTIDVGPGGNGAGNKK